MVVVFRGGDWGLGINRVSLWYRGMHQFARARGFDPHGEAVHGGRYMFGDDMAPYSVCAEWLGDCG